MRLAYFRRFKKPLATVLLIPFLISLFPSSLLAITSGPGQEEFANFEPAQTTELVNLYTGDFTYNIPLINVPGPNGGYPINLFYNSGVTVNEAGSWVGLGWNLNIGSISRQLRGLPDDFNGEEIKQEMHLKKSFAVGIDVPKKVTEIFGIAEPSDSKWNTQIYYNNYKGLGYRISASFGIKGIANIGLSYDAQNGIGVDPGISLGKMQFATSYNSRNGLRGLNVQTSFGYTTKYTKVGKGIGRFGGGGSSALSFGFNGSVPNISVPTRTTHIDFDLKFGKNYQWPVFHVGRWGNWQGFAEWSKLVNGGTDVRNAYGYLHNQNADDTDYKDFNRPGLEYSKKVPNLSPAAYTFDPLIVTGAGVAGQYRPYRAKVEILNTPKHVSKTDGHRINLEFAAGNTFHLGLGYAYTDGELYNGPWRSGVASSFLNPNPTHTNNVAFQDYYYQLYGEQSGHLQSDDNQLEAWLGNEALRPVLDENANDYSMDDLGHFTNEKTGADLDADNYGAQPTLGARKNRRPKANYIQTLTAKEAFDYGFSKDLSFYVKNQAGEYVSQAKFTGSPENQLDKISEIIVNKEDGYRYVYGLPAVNVKQVDASFNVYPPYTDENFQSVAGDANTDIIAASGHTTNGASNQFQSKKTLPDYAHSWLLTHVVSADYQDRTGDGLTNDDPGYWMKFNYERTTGDGADEKFQWREPYAGANFIEGQKSNPADDMAAYVYGEKELYYLHTVETPTHVALLETSTRHDARGVISEANGKRDTDSKNAMRRLNKIRLFVKGLEGSLPDFENALPLQTAIFVYADPQDQASIRELCAGVPSATLGRGKLTLAQVYLTSENSTRGRLSPYRFSYGPEDEHHNPDFNRRNRDRWGFYQNNAGLFPVDYPYVRFPYTNQYQEPNADAWQLQEITLPTGGKLKVDYESDDYAYEMDKPAAQMFDIIHLGDDNVPDWTNVKNRFSAANNYTNMDDTDGDGNYRVYVHLSSPIPPPTDPASNGLSPNEYFKKYYLDQIDQVYYKVFANLTGNTNATSDYISGYAQLLKESGQYGVEANPSGEYVAAFITLKKEPIQKPSFDQDIHPFRKGALNFLKLNRSELINGYDPSQSDPGNFIDQVGNVVGSIFQFFEELMTMSMGFNRYAVNVQDWADNIYLNGQSVIRLNNGTGFMYGGGNRVKEVRLSNEWNYGAGADEYGQQFDYTLEEEGRVISSGVAITPQGFGGEESALLNPKKYDFSTPLLSSQNLFIEKPVMKSYYPGPGVGYRKVTVKSLADQLPEAPEDSYAPITVHEFFTHKDFPVVERETDLSSDSPIHDWAIFPLFGSKMKKHTARAQGYSIELNDMAGKLKAITKSTHPTQSNPVSTVVNRSEYVYHTKEPYSNTGSNQLSNEVKILQSNGTLADGVIGQTHDIFHDFHEKASKANQYGADFNLDYWQLGIFPLFVPTLFPTININESSIKTAVTHKIIYKTGLLKEVIATDGQSTIATANVAYDQITARPVLTRTTNEFKDYIYSLAEPAYWKYDDPTNGSMAGAYRNLEMDFAAIPNPSGFIGISGAPNYFVKGDELWIQYPDGSGEKTYVNYVTGNGVGCLRQNGSVLSYAGLADISIIRSGNRNLLNSSIASTTFKGTSNAGTTDEANLLAKNSNVLNTSASTYKSDWDALHCKEYYQKTRGFCEVRDDLLAFLDIVADPNIGPSGFNDLAHIQDNLYNWYAPYITDNIWADPTSPNMASYSPFYYPNLYNPPNPFPAVGPDELHIAIKSCNDCNNGSCDIRLKIQNPPSGFDWADITEVTHIMGTDPGDLYQFILQMEDAAGTVYQAVSVVNTCYQICWDEPNLAGKEEVSQGRQQNLLSLCDYELETCAAANSNSEGINPYSAGRAGVWRPYQSFAFKALREYENATNGDPRLREFSAYDNFVPFDWSSGANNEANDWVKSFTNTTYSINGEILEELDALGNNSAAQYGYGKHLVVGIGKNMAYREIAVDNFEDYNKDCTDHFKFSGAQKDQNVVREEAHSGRYSLKVNPGEEGPFVVKYLPGDAVANCISTFRPIPGERYILSAWVKETDNGEEISTTTKYENPTIRIQFCDGDNTFLPDLKASGVIIDGWQRIYTDFTIPAATVYFEMKLLNTSTSVDRIAYFDDLRIHPFDGNLNTFVYDPETLKIMATLDENNYATYTIRNEEGQAIKYNVESEKGIVTTIEGAKYVKGN